MFSAANMSIVDFYGQKAGDSSQDDDLVSVVKSRRLHAAKAAEEKRVRDKEERIRFVINLYYI